MKHLKQKRRRKNTHNLVVFCLRRSSRGRRKREKKKRKKGKKNMKRSIRAEEEVLLWERVWGDDSFAPLGETKPNTHGEGCERQQSHDQCHVYLSWMKLLYWENLRDPLMPKFFFCTETEEGRRRRNRRVRRIYRRMMVRMGEEKWGRSVDKYMRK